MLGPVHWKMGRMTAARHSPGVGMWVTVGCWWHLGHAGFSEKYCSQRCLTKVPGGHKAGWVRLALRWPVFGYWCGRHLETARCVAIWTYAWIALNFGHVSDTASCKTKRVSYLCS
jgi:hypothetical protein